MKLAQKAVFIIVVAFSHLCAAASLAQDERSSFQSPDPTSPTTTVSQLDLLTVPMTAGELAELAEVWQDHLKSELAEVSRLNLELLEASEARTGEIRDEISSEAKEQQEIQEKYAVVLEAWKKKSPTDENIVSHETYLAALRIETLRTIDPRAFSSFALDWMTSTDGGLGFLLKVLGFVLALWLMMFIARFSKRGTERVLKRVPEMSRLLKNFLTNAVYWATFALGVLLVLGWFGVNVTPLFAVFGGLSFIIGFALQDTLGNLASGLMIMVLKPFDTGDYIEVSGASGFVDEMSVVSTQVRTFDNQIVVVPNSKIWGNIITNVSASAERRVDLVFGIAYSDDASQAIGVLKKLVAAHHMCLETPVPEVFVGGLGDSSVNIFCRPWVKSDDYWTVYWDLTGQAKEAFDEEGISIPFPQRDVHLIPAETQNT